MVQRRKSSAEGVDRQGRVLAERDFGDVLQEERENNDMLVAVGSNLARIGKRLVDLGKTLEKPETIPTSFELKELEDLIAQIPALITQYHEKCAKKMKLQSQLTNLSWHRS
jgi:hypothetical protein